MKLIFVVRNINRIYFQLQIKVILTDFDTNNIQNNNLDLIDNKTTVIITSM